MFGAGFHRALIDRLDSGLRHLGTREHLQIAELLRSPAQSDKEELAAALASVLARDRDEWERVAGMVRETYAASPLPRGRGDLERPAQPKVRADRTRQYVATALLALVTLGSAGVAWHFLVRPPPRLLTTEPPPPPPPPTVQIKQQPDFLFEELESAWEKERQLPGQPVAVLRDWWPVCAAGLLAWLLGLRLLLLPGGIVESRRRRAEQIRDQWHRQQLESGAPPLLPYRVGVDPPLPAQAIEDAAQYLGRLHKREGRGALDVPATIDQTIGEGGRPSPVWEVPRRQQELLVLVDEEGGDSPYLGGFRRICERWRRLGVGLTVLPLQQSAAALEELERRHGGGPLLVFSRELSMHGLRGPAPLLAAVEAFWPRAWLDPDPRTDAEREEVERRHAREIGKRLQRFPLSRKGLVLLARHLGGEVLPGAAEWEPLLPLHAVDGAIRRWAQLAALVPDPTWDQLEWLRQKMPSLALLDRAAYVHRLLEWLLRRGQRDAEQGARLRIDHGLEIDLRGELRREEGPERREERAVRQELLRQLEGVQTADELTRELLLVKRALHGAALEPARADELLLQVADSPLHELVQREMPLVDAPLTRQVLGGAAVSLRDLFWVRAAWSRGALAVVAVTGVFLMVGGLVPWAPWSRLRRPGVVDRLEFAGVELVKRVERPKLALVDPVPPPKRPKPNPVLVKRPRTAQTQPVEQPEQPVGPAEIAAIQNAPMVTDMRWPATPYRASMVRIKAGSFTMGSPKDETDHSNDEVQHRVQITRDFALAVTEVTQGQYQRVMGDNPSHFKGDSNLPVENVSWFDAVKYCNKLSAQEKLEECYKIDGERVTWPKLQDCQGFRLPTEAEWEYAARAGGRMLFSGSNAPEQVAWYYGNSEKKTHAVGKLKPNAWGLYDMSGNVFEWVWDRYDTYAGKIDPVGAESGQYRVLRGGSWFAVAVGARVAYRFLDLPAIRNDRVGFRVARSLPF